MSLILRGASWGIFPLSASFYDIHLAENIHSCRPFLPWCKLFLRHQWVKYDVILVSTNHVARVRSLFFTFARIPLRLISKSNTIPIKCFNSIIYLVVKVVLWGWFYYDMWLISSHTFMKNIGSVSHMWHRGRVSFFHLPLGHMHVIFLYNNLPGVWYHTASAYCRTVLMGGSWPW